MPASITHGSNAGRVEIGNGSGCSLAAFISRGSVAGELSGSLTAKGGGAVQRHPAAMIPNAHRWGLDGESGE